MKNVETVPDERVASATKHWALRFVSNGIELGAFQSTIQRIERWEQWCAEWGVTARHYELIAEAAEARGDMLTAGEGWVRAAMCWHFGKFVFVQDLVEQRAAHDALLLQKLSDAPRGPIEAATAIATGLSVRSLLAKDRAVALR